MSIKRDDVVAALRAEDVADHLTIKGQWRGRWMRSHRCAETDHASAAFGIARDGRWHCWSCDKGGDLLGLLALGERLDIKSDFPRVLEIAAAIAGVDDDNEFGAPVKPVAPERPDPPLLLPLPQRIALAKRRAAWVWDRLYDQGSLTDSYLRSRGLDPQRVQQRESIRTTPLKIQRPDQNASDELRSLWWTMGSRRGSLAIVIPVRAVDDGRMIDLRARRVEPEEGQPKIIGMLGGVTSSPAERGRTRQLLGCYGNPHSIDSDHVVIVEGLMDHLTAIAVWPNATVLGAVEAGSLGLVTGHAARVLAARDSTSHITIVEQCDPPRTLHDGRVVAGAADASINEDPNAATKVAVRHLGPNRVGWLFCEAPGDDGVMGSPCRALGGKPIKDLNDLVVCGRDVSPMVVRWESPAADD